MAVRCTYRRTTIVYNVHNNNMDLNIIIESLLCGCSCMHMYIVVGEGMGAWNICEYIYICTYIIYSLTYSKCLYVHILN